MDSRLQRCTEVHRRVMRAHIHYLAPSLLGALVFAGCIGNIGDGSDGAESSAAQALCEDAGPDVGFAPLRRLTRLEYDSTVRDLLGDDTRPAQGFISDEIVGGYAANAIGSIDKTQLEDYFEAAEKLAEETVATRAAELTDCDLDDPSCMHGFVRDLGRRAFRRPLDADQEQRFVTLYDGARAEWGGAEALELVIAAMLMSPQFLYHVELSAPLPGEAVVLLDDYELAARLSYSLWSSMPDDALLDAAERGELSTAEGLSVQAERLLADARASEALASFASQWLQLDAHGEFERLYKDPSVFPDWTPDLAAAMRAETVAFFDGVVRGDGRLDSLLTSEQAFEDETLAGIYGTRAGLLTQPSVLASQAHAADVSWARRGKLVREQLLCETLTPPPPDVDMNTANDPDRLADPKCKGCHLLMDPIGYGFDRYDAIGRERDVDGAGEPVETAGEIHENDGTDVSGSFDGLDELAALLVSSDQVERCFATQWFRYATRRQEGDAERCSLGKVQDRFVEANDIQELIMAVVLSDAFRYRRGGTP